MANNRLNKKIEEYKLDTHYLPVLNGFRAISIILVAWFHIWQQSWLSPDFTILGVDFHLMSLVRTGYIWVDMLVLLSGFLLFLPVARHMVEGEPLVDTKTFYKKRARRILPSYLLSIGVMLFVFAIPNREYANFMEGFWDVVSHLTFTSVFSYSTYHYTRLNFVLWTLIIEIQFYLLFPLIAHFFKKNPVGTFLVMFGMGLFYRYYIIMPLDNVNLYFNQLPAFLDIYAMGMMGALFYVAYAKHVKCKKQMSVVFTIIAIAVCIIIYRIVDDFSSVTYNSVIGKVQMSYRNQLGALNMLLIFSTACATSWWRWLFGNKVMGFLAMISYNFYVWHQFIATKFRLWNIPFSTYEFPNREGQEEWQLMYTLLVVTISITLATIITFFWERPFTKHGLGLFKRRKSKGIKRKS